MMTLFHNQQILSLPALLLTGSFDEGRYNKPWSGGDWNEYQKGRNEKEMYDERTKGNTTQGSKNSGGGNFNNDGGGGGCLGQIILITLTLAIAIPSAIAALISGLVMILVLNIAIPSFSTVSFREAFVVAFWTTSTYLIVGIVLAFFQVWLYPNLNGWNEELSISTLIKYFNFLDWYELVKPLNLIGLHLICILSASLILQKKMKVYFGGYNGYRRSFITTALIILPSLLVAIFFTGLLL